jgi:hypothetical protein
LHNSKDIPNNGEINLNKNNTLETIAHLVKENKGLSDSVKTLQSELKQCKREYQNNCQIQRNVSSTALPGRIDEPGHCSGNNIILDTTLTRQAFLATIHAMMITPQVTKNPQLTIHAFIIMSQMTKLAQLVSTQVFMNILLLTRLVLILQMLVLIYR